jgi:hypothetical protein
VREETVVLEAAEEETIRQEILCNQVARRVAWEVLDLLLTRFHNLRRTRPGEVEEVVLVEQQQ